MKKILIVLIAVVAFVIANAFITTPKTSTVVAPPPSCQLVKGVTMSCTPNGNQYTVKVENTNNYKVNVNLKAIGYRNGDMRVVWNDELILNASGSSHDDATRTFSTTAEDVAVKMTVLKCTE